MRRVAYVLVVLLSLVPADVLQAQQAGAPVKATPRPQPQTPAQPKQTQPPKQQRAKQPQPQPTTAQPVTVTRPQFRPAVLGSGPTSLINRIDGAALLKAGQKDGAVMFVALVAPSGSVVESRTYRAMPGSDALDKEVSAKLREAKVAPAIYNHQPVTVLLYGTVVFAVDNGKPRVRIFLHQDPLELAKQSDFIGPQPVFGAGFDGFTPPVSENPVPVSAIVDLGLKVDATGRLIEMRLVKEEPPLLGFGQAAVKDFEAATFIPAFRDGDPDESETVVSVFYPAP